MINTKIKNLQQEINDYQQIIDKYKMNQEYVNPSISLNHAKETLERLIKEFYLGYRID